MPVDTTTANAHGRVELTRLLDAIAIALPLSEAIRHGSVSRSRADLKARTNQLANALLGLGLGRRPEVADAAQAQDRLGIMLPNGAEYLEAVIGAHKARVTPFNVNFHYTSREVSQLVSIAAPRAIVYHVDFEPVVVAAGLTPEVLLIRVGSAQASGHQAIEFEALVEGATSAAPPGVPSPEDVHLLFTGGTTGNPKGVMWPTGELMAGPMRIRGRAGDHYPTMDEAVESAVEGDHVRALSAAPFMHGAGLLFALAALCRGHTVVIPPGTGALDGREVMLTCARERVRTMIVVGPAMGLAILDGLRDLAGRPLALRTIINTGAGMGESVLRRLSEHLPAVRIVDAVGSSETGPEATRTATEHGRFVLGMDTEVVTPGTFRPLRGLLPAVGLLARTGHIPLGYLNDPSATAATFRTIEGKRYVVTGDRVRLHPDRSFELLGRQDDVINTGGEKVFADEVSDVLRTVDGVEDVAVMGRPSERWGSEVIAFVQRRHREIDLIEHCRQQLARYKVPKEIIDLERIPRRPNGKLDRRRLHDLVEEHGSTEP